MEIKTIVNKNVVSYEVASDPEPSEDKKEKETKKTTTKKKEEKK